MVPLNVVEGELRNHEVFTVIVTRRQNRDDASTTDTSAISANCVVCDLLTGRVRTKQSL